jgi:hypothetical protein
LLKVALNTITLTLVCINKTFQLELVFIVGHSMLFSIVTMLVLQHHAMK